MGINYKSYIIWVLFINLKIKRNDKKKRMVNEQCNIKALFDKLLKMFKPLKMKIFNGFNFSICLITKF